MSFIRIVTVVKKVVTAAAGIGAGAVVDNIVGSHIKYMVTKPKWIAPFLKFCMWCASIGLGYTLSKVAEKGIDSLFSDMSKAITDF